MPLVSLGLNRGDLLRQSPENLRTRSVRAISKWKRGAYVEPNEIFIPEQPMVEIDITEVRMNFDACPPILPSSMRKRGGSNLVKNARRKTTLASKQSRSAPGY